MLTSRHNDNMKIINSNEYVSKREPHEVIWTDVPLFQPTSTPDKALHFIASFGGENRKLFEFGTWVGRSALGFSQNFSEVVTIDYIQSSDINYSYQFNDRMMRSGELVKDRPNVICLNEDSMVFPFSKYEKTFDVVYVDGNHSKAGCLSDLNSAMRIAKKDSYIFVDDYPNETMGVRSAVDEFQHDNKFFFPDIGLIMFRNKQ